MADLIRVRCGALGGREAMPNLEYDVEKGAELGYRTDEKALYIGTASGNVRLCGVEELTKISEVLTKLDDITARLEALEAPTEAPSE